jgi:ribosomal-protein-alanine N-acetyltransferase
MFIRTERLLLRPSWPEDLDELLELLSEDEIAQNLGVKELPRTREELQALLSRPRAPMLPHFFVNLRQSNATPLIGGIGLGRNGDEVELGYWIAKPYRGQGFAEEAVRAVLNQARAIGHRSIVACHFADSTASASVLEKAGFTRTGETRDRYSIGRGSVAPANVYVVDLAKGLAQDELSRADPPPIAQ